MISWKYWAVFCFSCWDEGGERMSSLDAFWRWVWYKGKKNFMVRLGRTPSSYLLSSTTPVILCQENVGNDDYIVNKIAFQLMGDRSRTGYTETLICSCDFDLDTRAWHVVVVVFFFQYNQSWTSLPSIVLSSNRYPVHDAWSFENCWTVIPVHLQLLVPLTFWPLAEIGWAKCLFPHHQSWNPNAGCRCWHRKQKVVVCR